MATDVRTQINRSVSTDAVRQSYLGFSFANSSCLTVCHDIQFFV